MSPDDPSDQSTPTCVIVIDDDPTGSQSIANLPLLTRWRDEDLAWAFEQGAPAVYVLTNSRSLPEEDAVTATGAVVVAATRAAAAAGIRPIFVSRSDSTLRGHFPAETDVIDAAAEGRADGVLLVPAFPAAGRVTLHGVHYVETDGVRVPAADTEFAGDATFGYHHSALSEYVEEKTRGAVRAADVLVLDIDTVRAGPAAVADHLTGVTDGRVVVADAETEEDLELLAEGLRAAEARGKRFVYRTGPSFARALIGQDPPVRTSLDVVPPRADAAHHGLVVVGSHTNLTTEQLRRLSAALPDTEPIVLDVTRILDGENRPQFLAETVRQAVSALRLKTVIIATSRTLVRHEDAVESLRISTTISRFVIDVVHSINAVSPPRWLIAKGGITSHDVAAHGLEISRATVIGPLLDGLVSLWLPEAGPAVGIPFVVFPGNVGGPDDLAAIVTGAGIQPQPN